MTRFLGNNIKLVIGVAGKSAKKRIVVKLVKNPGREYYLTGKLSLAILLHRQGKGSLKINAKKRF